MKNTIFYAIISCLIFLTACEPKEEDKLDIGLPPQADFSIEFIDGNNVQFINTTTDDNFIARWDFGAQGIRNGNEVDMYFPLMGDYSVSLTVFGQGGSSAVTKTITIESDAVVPNINIIENGEFDGDDSWIILPITDGVDVTFENGTAVWTGGAWGHKGIYQEFQVEANQRYQIDMNISGSGLTDCWFEVYVGTEVPTPGVDYVDGGIRLGLNTWDGCGSSPFDALLTAITCSNNGGDGSFEFSTAGTAYLVIRGGGADFGSTGVTIDNVTVSAI